MGIFDALFSGSNTTTTSQPSWFTNAATKSTDLASRAADVGYVPKMGADVAAFTPQQLQAMQGAQNRYSMFQQPGQPVPQVADSIPKAQDFGGGLRGYSSYGGFQAQMAALEKAYPGIAEMLRGFSKNPQTTTRVAPPTASNVGGPGSGVIPTGAMPPPPPPPAPPVPAAHHNLGFGGVNPDMHHNHVDHAWLAGR